MTTFHEFESLSKKLQDKTREIFMHVEPAQDTCNDRTHALH